MRWTPGEQTRITLLTPFINSDKYRSNEFTNSETLYESENNSNRVWKREITKLKKSLLLYPLSDWAVKAIICLSFHLHTLFVIYVSTWVWWHWGDTLKESAHVNIVLLWCLSRADNYSAPFIPPLPAKWEVMFSISSPLTTFFPWFHSILPSTFTAPWFRLEHTSHLLFYDLISGIRSQRSVMGHGIIL